MLFYHTNHVLFLFIFFQLSGFCQENTQGKIIDSDTKATISQVNIINLEKKDTLLSTRDGHFELKNQGIFIFQKNGYLQKTVKITNNNFQVVQLSMNTSQLNEVIVNANQIPTELNKTINSMSMLSTKDIELGYHTDMSSVLNKATGVFMQSGSLNTNRITIRGIGSRTPYGTAKIRAYFKDIPLTNGSGETAIEDFELASISRFEIIKGAVSSSFGAGLGGTIQMTPKNADFNETKINSELSGGSFGLIKGIIAFNHGSQKQNINAIYSNTHSDGYRENNNYDRQTFTINSNHYLGKKDELSFLLSYVDSKAYIPSSLNETDYINHPESADTAWKNAQGFEDAQRGIFGVSWQHDYTSNSRQLTSIFTSFRNAYEPRPFNILDEKSFAYGIRTRVLGETQIFNKNLNYTLGGEFFLDHYQNQTFQNLYQNFPPGTGSVKGNPLSNFKEKRHYYNLFVDSNFDLTKNTSLSIGFNINQTAYDLKDKFPVSSTNPDQSGTFTFKTMWSPKFGLSHALSKNISIFSNISHGFSPISLAETLLPDGQINNNIEPETGWNYELGTRGSALKKTLQFSASIFRLNVKNLLVPRRTDSDAYIGINAGETQHDGLEIELNYIWTKNKDITVGSFLNYTLNRFKFKEFIDDTIDYSGNDLTGVPSNVFNMGLNVASQMGLYGNINFQHVGSMPITDSNSLYTNSYNLSNLKIGYKRNLNKSLKLKAFCGINNIFDKVYASQILINASDFGGSAPRYFYPGTPINYYGGIHISYLF